MEGKNLNQEIEIKKFDGSLDELAYLFQTEYDHDKPLCKPSFLDWQYNGEDGKAIIVAAYDKAKNNMLAAVYIINPIRIVLDEKVYKACLSLNTFTHKEYRGKGLFISLANEAYQQAFDMGIRYIIGFPNEASYGGFIKKLGFLDVGYLTNLIKPISYTKILKNILGINSYSLSPIEKNYENDLVFKKIENIQDLSDNFLFQCHKSNKFYLFKSLKYITWRYIKHPLIQYQIYGLYKQSVLVGYSIFSIKKVGRWNIGSILENGWVSENLAAFVLKGSLYVMNRSGAAIANTFVTLNTNLAICYKEHGFIVRNKIDKNAKPVVFIIKDIMENTTLSIQDCLLFPGDTDVF